MKNTLFAIIILFFLIMPCVNGLGVSPATKEILGDKEITYNLRIFNDNAEEAELKIEIRGDLSEYLKTDKSSVKLTESSEIEDIKIVFTPPKEKIDPGKYETKIIIKNKQKSSDNIIAHLGIASTLTVNIPYDTPVIESVLLAPNFKSKETKNFVVEVKNIGSENTEAFAVLEIFTELNNKIQTTTTEKKLIKGKSDERFIIPWTATEINGKYLAKATILYSEDKQTESQKEFTIGSKNVKVDSIIVSNFKLGGIASMDMIISTDWGEEIKNVFIKTSLENDDKILSESVSQTISISPFSKKRVPVYLNTENVAPGNYMMSAQINFEEHTNTEVYDVKLTDTNMIITSITGHAIGESISTDSQYNILYMLIFIVFILNISLFVFVIKRNKKNR